MLSLTVWYWAKCHSTIVNPFVRGKENVSQRSFQSKWNVKSWSFQLEDFIHHPKTILQGFANQCLVLLHDDQPRSFARLRDWYGDRRDLRISQAPATARSNTRFDIIHRNLLSSVNRLTARYPLLKYPPNWDGWASGAIKVLEGKIVLSQKAWLAIADVCQQAHHDFTGVHLWKPSTKSNARLESGKPQNPRSVIPMAGNQRSVPEKTP